MSWKEDLTEKLSALSTAEFDYIETRDINRASDIDLNCSGIYMEATIIYFEIKNLNYMLKEQGRRKVAQAYTMYREVIGAIVEREGAFVNCFAPNAFLVVFPGKEDDMSPAVKCAMKIVHALSEDYKQKFEHIVGIEFSIGIDHGHIMGTKNLSDIGMEHLSWFGTCIFKAMRVAKDCSHPFYIGITSLVYHNLSEEMRISTKRILGLRKSVDVWTKVTYQYENVKKHLYQTNHKLPIDDEEK
jgi:class 3 adenylate cyclase